MNCVLVVQAKNIKNVAEPINRIFSLLELRSLLLEDLRVSIVAFEQKLAEVRVSL